MLKPAIRALSHTPWYAALSVGVIALSMALATTTFLIVDGVLFKRLPFERPDELYVARGSWLRQPSQRVAVSAKDYRDWSAANPELQVAAIGLGGLGGRIGDFPGRLLDETSVTENLLDVIGVRPILGGFSPADFAGIEPNGPVLISYAVWQSAFGGRPDVVGQRLEFPGTSRAHRVAGVLPEDFVFPSDRAQPDLIRPLAFTPADLDRRDRRRLSLVVRVPSGVPIDRAQQQLDRTAQQLVPDFPANSRLSNGAFDRVHLDPLAAGLTRQARPTFLIVFAASAVLIVLACLNLAALGVARVEDRAAEMAIRRALGASAGTLARLQLAETGLIATAGALVGLALTPVLSSLTLRLLPASLVLLKPPAIDVRVLMFTALATTGVALLVSIWPSMVAARSRLRVASSTGGTRRVRRLNRRVLIAAQAAVGLVLAIVGTLLVGSVALLWSEDPGYARADAVIVEARPSGDEAATRAEISDLVARFQGIPGVTAAAAFDGPFLDNSTRADMSWRTPAGAAGGCLAGPKSGVTSGFFAALDLQPLDGRLPTAAEIDRGDPFAVMSQAAIRTCWPDGSRPIGRTIEMDNRQFTVIGVVRDVRFESFDRASRGEVYASYRIVPPFTTVFVLRTEQAAGAFIAPVVAALREANMLARTERVSTMSEALAESIRPRRLNAWLFGLFAVAALAIVGVGILGVMAMTTVRRTHEIGVRYALGGRPRDVVRLLLREQIVDVGLGVMAGAAAAAWAVQFTESYLYRFAPTDPRLWTIAAATVIITAMAGALVPALRASRVDPVRALRAE